MIRHDVRSVTTLGGENVLSLVTRRFRSAASTARHQTSAPRIHMNRPESTGRSGLTMRDVLPAATDSLCGCGCGRPLNPNGPSTYFASEACQRVWNERLSVAADEHVRLAVQRLYTQRLTAQGVTPQDVFRNLSTA